CAPFDFSMQVFDLQASLLPCFATGIDAFAFFVRPIPSWDGIADATIDLLRRLPSGWGTHWIGERSVEPNPLPPPFCVG
ncbi:hypothetical protein ABLN72_16775, partial [Mycobacterium tuberculosis]